MSMRNVITRASYNSLMAGTGRTHRYFSNGDGRVFEKEERAMETMYIQKMEKENMEKLRLQKEKEQAAASKVAAEKDPFGKDGDAAEKKN